MEVTLYRANGTAKATFFMFHQRRDVEDTASAKRGIWIPKTVYKVLSREPDAAWQWPEHRIKLAYWWAKANHFEIRRTGVLAGLAEGSAIALPEKKMSAESPQEGDRGQFSNKQSNND